MMFAETKYDYNCRAEKCGTHSKMAGSLNITDRFEEHYIFSIKLTAFSDL